MTTVMQDLPAEESTNVHPPPGCDNKPDETSSRDHPRVEVSVIPTTVLIQSTLDAIVRVDLACHSLYSLQSPCAHSSSSARKNVESSERQQSHVCGERKKGLSLKAGHPNSSTFDFQIWRENVNNVR